jgi:hypothetical protein
MVLIQIVIGIINGVKVIFDLFLFKQDISFVLFLGGASRDPCSDTYCGEKAFSEIETTQVSQFIAANKDSIIHYINFHSYSQLWMTPWGKYSKNSLRQMFFFSRIYNTETRPVCLTGWWFGKSCRCTRCCFWFVHKFNISLIFYSIISGTQYTHGNIGTTIYIASGNTVDWTFGTANVTYSYAVELRDTGKCLFVFFIEVFFQLFFL